MSATIDSRPLFLRATSVMFALVQSGLMLAGIILLAGLFALSQGDRRVVEKLSSLLPGDDDAVTMVAYGLPAAEDESTIGELSPRMRAYAIRNHTGDRVDDSMGMPMHRGLGPHLRGTTPTVRGLGAIASPHAFGHGGVGTSYCWGDPDSGVSFAYITNNRVPDPWHSERLDVVSTLVHAAIL